MSYQVLARKWRPSKFAELVGQEHVKSALINGLTNQRLHHAYLFSGTRGVGKTSIARIFAKSLNCETGITAEPCGQCGTCVDVDAGRFVDLIEIDAASRTKVGDTREILDNVQYAPTRGRYKIYLIDEVHMLSRHSFNALLKTLEEPPEHVKFLLATTDPQKLPVTILSRCLQFNLQALDAQQIEQQLIHILNAEQIQYEPPAVKVLAKYAHGSMRDGLSLTDQGIAQSGENLTLSVVQSMLGTVDVAWSQNILSAILSGQGERVVDIFNRLEKQRPDFVKVLDDLLGLCHQVSMAQILPAAAKLSIENEAFVLKVAKRIPATQIQVYYQLLLQGKKDLPYAPDLARGFEMICLRLLAFKPVEPGDIVAEPSDVSEEDADGSELKKNSEITADPFAAAAIPHVDQTRSAKISPQQEPTQDDALTANRHSSEIPKSAVQVDNFDEIDEHRAPRAEAKPTIVADTKPQVPSEGTAGSHITTQEVADTSEQSATSAPNTENVTTEYDDYQWLSEASEEDNSELLSQQAFYQDMAQSQGFQPQGTGAAPTSVPSDTSMQPETPAPIENPALLSDSEHDNPVLAILANRGKPTDLSKAAELATPSSSLPEVSETADNTTESAAPLAEQAEETPLPELKPIEDDEVKFAHEVDEWARLIEMSGLMGLGRQLARNGEVRIDGDNIELIVKKEFAHLVNEKSEAELTAVVSKLAPASNFVINKSDFTEMAPADIQQNINMNRQERAEQSIADDKFVQTLVNEFGGKVLPDSIRPVS